MNLMTAAVVLGTCLATTLPTASTAQPAAPSQAHPAAAAETLPDSTVLARIADRVITVGQFRERYYAADPTMRPERDSTGRVEFLASTIDKDILGLTAQGLATPLRFEDRAELRAYENEVLATAFYERQVVDPVTVTAADLRKLYPQFSYALRLRRLVLSDRATAERVRADLVKGRTTWKDAVRLYASEDDTLARQGSDWLLRSQVSGRGATAIFDLQPPQISTVIPDVEGYHIWQCLERQKVEPPTYLAVRLVMTQQLREARQGPLEDAFFEKVRARAQARYDTANIAWLAGEFSRVNPRNPAQEHRVIDLTSNVPQIAPSDTGRVLAWTHGAAFSAGSMMSRYRRVPGLMRRKIRSYATLFQIVDRMVLQDDILALAREQGFERDPVVAKKVALRREGLMVERMYTDSVEAHVRVTEAQRRQAYAEYGSRLTVPGRARFAYIIRRTEAGADSVLAQLAAGMPAEMIVLADSLAGMRYGATRELGEDEPSGYNEILFGELQPGGATKAPLGDAWVVLHLYARTETRPQSYEEAQATVDEVVRSAEAERLLKDWLGRLRTRYRVESHPEWLMGFSMTPKTPARVLPEDEN